MKSKTLSYAALAVVLGLTGTVIANKIIGNGYRDDPACKGQNAGTADCDDAATATLARSPSQVPAPPMTVRSASGAMTVSKPD